MSRQIITATRRLYGELRVPGDKSISHRAVLISALGEGPTFISGLSDAEDVQATVRALRALGVVISNDNSQVEIQEQSSRESDLHILVDGRGWAGLRPAPGSISCQNSGTTARTLMGALAGRPFLSAFEGDDSLSRRPMKRVIDPLVEMGAAIEATDGRLPLTLRGGDLHGIDFRSPVASAQVKSAVLLAGLQASGETLEYLSVPIERSTDRLIVKLTNIRNASSLSVPGDLSSAAFLLVGTAILPGSEVRIVDVGLNPTRTGILDVLRAFGADVEIERLREESGEPVGTVTVRAGDRRPLHIEGDAIVRTVDELPLVAVLGAVAEGETVIRNAAELRVKESDRIAAMAEGLGTMGVRIEVTDDGMMIRGGRPLRGASVGSRGDHRVAMALAVAGLAAEGETPIDGWEAVGVSYPRFLEDLNEIAQR
ncbi:MAG: 3-phosphoshikimate 1-carboxyvinyltransferase [Actinobacteria bacterium]|nr:MAG: 3-phosphoshikimate 1-carboxyvinyltransferase [Actinomycetota bacterium]